MTSNTEGEAHVHTVLLIDDEPFIQDIVGMMLEGLGYEVLLAADGSEGVRLVATHRNKILLIVCDLSMPGMDGWQTISAIRQIAPELPVILASGYAIEEQVQRKHPDQPWMIMQKPFVYDELERILRRVSGEAEMVSGAGNAKR
jgi:CheY-like chemotaxis protein